MGARHSVEVWWWFASNVRCAFDKVPGTLWWRLWGASKWRAAGGTRGQALRAGWLKLMHAGTDAAQAG